MFFKKYFFSLPLLIFSFHTQAQSAEEIVSKYMEFSGGEKAWKKIKTIVTTGEYKYGGMSFLFTSFSKAPDLYKYEASLNGVSYVQSYNGKQGWKIDGFSKETKPTELTGNEAVKMANEAGVELESPFINYIKKGNVIEYEGTDTIDSQPCFRIRLILKDNETETYYFSCDNFELVMKRAVSKNVEMKNALIDIYYSDYRTISGIKIPFTSISKVEGQTILTTTVEKVEINVPLKDSTFQL
ncbi:MAG: hypothetical protein ABIT08_16530 [Bacteroidia bacterium]